jgi:hypothetical protein
VIFVILVECNPDEYILTALAIPKSSIRHETGKGEILQKIKRGKANKALIDQDPNSNQPGELLNYVIVEENEYTALLKDRDRQNSVVMVKPRLEEWLLQRAKANRIDPANFDLPREGNALHKMIHVEKKGSFRILSHT